MKILKVADVHSGVGGMTNFMRRSGSVLGEWGHDVDYYFRQDLAPRNTHAGFRRIAVPWLVVRKIRRAMRAGHAYDVVEIHEPIAAAYCLVRRLLPRVGLPPCVVVSYGSEERHWRAQRARWRAQGERGRLKSRVLVPLTLLPQSRYAFRAANQVLVPSNRDGTYLRDELGVPPDRLTRVDSGVAEAYFGVRCPPFEGGELKVVFIASWNDRKGRRELAEAWSLLRQRGVQVALTLSCTVSGEAEVRSWFDDQHNIHVQPHATDDDLLALLGTQHVFVLPAWFEGGMPLAVLQAAAAGLPCVVTEIGGHIDIFRPDDPESDGGLLVPSNDPSALADAIERLASDPALVQRLGEAARVRAHSFTWRETAKNLLVAYEAALNGSSTDPRAEL